MVDPRDADPVEPTLVPDRPADEPTLAPDTHAAAHDATRVTPVHPAARPSSSPHNSEATQVPILDDSVMESGAGVTIVGSTEAMAEATHVPISSTSNSNRSIGTEVTHGGMPPAGAEATLAPPTGGAMNNGRGADVTLIGTHSSNAEVTQVPIPGNSTTNHNHRADVTLVGTPSSAAEATQAPPAGNSVTMHQGDATRVSHIGKAGSASQAPPGSSSVTEVDVTLQPTPGTSAPVDATQVPASARTSVPERTVAVSPEAASAAAPSGTVVGRFALRGLHARGGLGEVFTARDTELNREVAVKRIQTRYADDPASRRRFLSEAEITARLDHPGVVPVFGLVADGNGRPCYAMRFIRGETLKDEIERYHTAARGPAGTDGKSASTSEVDGQPRSVVFRHLLQRFIAVCQAIAYAHTRKVIHRDIKPANVMVGAFGETLVVDWGLAKALDDGPDPDHLLRAAAANGFRHDPDATELPDHLTMAGTAVGTPAYMSPEQASGRLDLLGPAADIYSLGATLFVILTGKAPFGGTTTETLDKVRRGDYPSPRAVNPEVPPPMDAVCRKAMALSIDDRYGTALELAADVERWLSDEPVSCFPDPLPARLARWARRHPARVAAAVSLLIAGVLAATGTTWAVSVEEGRTEKARQRAVLAEADTNREMQKVTQERNLKEEANKNLIVQKKKTDDERDAAIKARNAARDRYVAAVAAFNTLVKESQKQLADRAGTQELRRTILENARKGLNDLVSASQYKTIGADKTLVAACIQMGEVYQALGNSRQALDEFNDAVEMATGVLGRAEADKPPAGEIRAAQQDLGRAYLKQAGALLHTYKTVSAGERCMDAIGMFEKAMKDNESDPEAQKDLADAYDLYADILIELGRTLEAGEQCKTAMDIRLSLYTKQKTDLIAQRRLADSLDQDAEILLRGGWTAKALAAARTALAHRDEVFAKDGKSTEVRRERAAALTRVGEILLERDELTAADNSLTAALKAFEQLVDDDKKSATAKAGLASVRRSLAVVALREGDLKAARSYAEESLKDFKTLHADDTQSARAARDLASAHQQLGDVLLAGHKDDLALTEYQSSVDLLQPIVEVKDTDSVSAKLFLARALEGLGAVQLTAHKADAAAKTLEKSVGRLREAVAVDAGATRLKRDLALGMGMLGDALRSNGEMAKAQDTLSREVTLLQTIVRADKDSPARIDLSHAMGAWGDILAHEGKPTAALVVTQQAVDRLQALANADPEDAHVRSALAAETERLASLYARIGQGETARMTAHAALTMRLDLVKTVGDTTASRRDRAGSMVRLADVYFTIYNLGLARKWYEDAEKMLAVDKNDPVTADFMQLAEDKLSRLKAVETLTKDPTQGVAKLPPDQRLPTLRAAVETLVKADMAPEAGALAWQLIAASKLPEDRYRAAAALARCALSTKITETAQKKNAQDAVKALEMAVAVDFRDVDLLADPEWDACRNLDGFQQVLKKLGGTKGEK